MPDSTVTPTREQLEDALRLMAYGYLRIQEIGPSSAFAARAYRQACQLVDIDPAKHHLWAEPPEAPVPGRFRVGRSLGITVYKGPESSDVMGMMLTPEYAAMVVDALNRTSTPCCPECGGPYDRGCGARFHDSAPPAPEGFDPVGDRVRELQAPQPKVLWRSSTHDSNDRWQAREGMSFLGQDPELPVPPGTSIVIVEDTEAPQ